MLDGSVARVCKLQSKFGAFLDHISDGIYWFMHLFVLFHFLNNNKQLKKYISLYVLLITLFTFSYIYNTINEVVFTKQTYCVGLLPILPCSPIYHDNTLLLHFIFWFIVYNNKVLY